MKKLQILESGIRDLEEGRDFYEKSAQGIGDYFLNSAFSEIDSLKLYGGIHSKRFGFHRLMMKRFPFGIYYMVKEELVIVFRVLDCRRNPSDLQRLLEE